MANKVDVIGNCWKQQVVNLGTFYHYPDGKKPKFKWFTEM